jgi:hypothetical protein
VIDGPVMDTTDMTILLFLLFVASYMTVLIYLNAKVKPNQSQLPEKYAFLKTSISFVGISIGGVFLLMLLLFAIGVIFFRDEFLPR